MDREFIVYHSGFDMSRLKKLKRLVDNGFEISGVFVSYFSVLNDNGKIIRYLKYLKNKYDVSVMIDSGAHSILYYWLRKNGETIYMGHKENSFAKEIVDRNRYEWYVKRYVKFIEKYQDIFDIYVELDIQSIVGYDKVWKWRQFWKRKKLQPMLVWHGEKDEELEEMVKYGKYIGIGGTENAEDYEKLSWIYARKIRELDKGVWIHWFAFTNWRKIRQYLKQKIIDSVDSTSWGVGSRFGLVYVIEGDDIVNNPIGSSKKIKGIVQERNRMRFKKSLKENWQYLEAVGLDVQGMYDLKNWDDMNFWNIYVFEKYVDIILDKIRKDNSYDYDVLQLAEVKGNGVRKEFRVRKNMRLDRWFG